jgi:hypothetical protein
VEGWRWPIAHVAARQPKWRTVGRAAAYHILWVRGIGDHTISRRGFNLFKQLRRHFRATPFCSHALSRRDPGDQNASVPKIDDRLGGLLREGGRGASESRKFAAGQSLSGMGDRHDGREGKLRVAIFCLSVPFLIHRKRYHTFCRSQCKNRSHLISLINLLLARHCANTARSLSHIYIYTTVICIAFPRAVSIGQVLLANVRMGGDGQSDTIPRSLRRTRAAQSLFSMTFGRERLKALGAESAQPLRALAGKS